MKNSAEKCSEMQRNAKKCSEMQRDAEKCREMKRNEEKYGIQGGHWGLNKYRPKTKITKYRPKYL